MTVHRCKKKFELLGAKRRATLCVAVESHRGDLFELIPIPLEPRGQLEGAGRARAGGVEGGYSYAICQKGSRTREIPQFILPYVTPSQGNGR